MFKLFPCGFLKCPYRYSGMTQIKIKEEILIIFEQNILQKFNLV